MCGAVWIVVCPFVLSLLAIVLFVFLLVIVLSVLMLAIVLYMLLLLVIVLSVLLLLAIVLSVLLLVAIALSVLFLLVIVLSVLLLLAIALSVLFLLVIVLSVIRLLVIVLSVLLLLAIVLSVLLLLSIVLSVLLRFTDSDYPFGIFKLLAFLSILKCKIKRKQSFMGHESTVSILSRTTIKHTFAAFSFILFYGYFVLPLTTSGLHGFCTHGSLTSQQPTFFYHAGDKYICLHLFSR